jgi:galactose mutarotase-like enzyme
MLAALDFGAFPDLLAGFPFPHCIELEIELRGAALTVRTTLHPTGAIPVPVAFGFHPYLALPGAPREDWVVSLPARRRLRLDPRGLPTGGGDELHAETHALADAAYDDALELPAGAGAFSVAGGGRRVYVTFLEGYPAAQVFAPPGGSVVSFEPMTAPTGALSSGRGLRLVAPGERFEAAFRISIEEDPDAE